MAAGLESKLNLPPTNACLSVILAGEDYGLKVNINGQISRYVLQSLAFALLA